MGQRFLERCEQLGGFVGFSDEVERTTSQRVLDAGKARITANHHHFGAHVVIRHPFQHVMAADIGHDQVEQNDVEDLALQRIQGGLPTEGFDHRILVQTDQLRQARQQLWFVVNQQDARIRRRDIQVRADFRARILAQQVGVGRVLVRHPSIERVTHMLPSELFCSRFRHDRAIPIPGSDRSDQSGIFCGPRKAPVTARKRGERGRCGGVASGPASSSLCSQQRRPERVHPGQCRQRQGMP